MKFLKTFTALALFSIISSNVVLAQEEYTQEASVYSIGRYGKKMTNGEYLSSRHRTCSHDFLPAGSLIQITNLANNRSEVVEVNGKSQSTSLELTHSVAHDLGLTGVHKATVKVFVMKKADANANPMPVAEQPKSKSHNMTYGSQTSYSTMPVFTNPEPAVEKKKTYEFPKEFPQHEPMKFDTATKKVLMNGKPIVPEKERPVYKEKIIMN
ncbi:rare lipoprotein A [Arcicella aurantiaca]|uniref:Rare lipoprotein A n=1 Tax=Arcicella aurantiaca TaxID=591202 RepID=A0A316DYM3_9BACT|nr:septal ring lytic transglycosylase RlpA family protein [Arcicella aurantiaca]PWK23025.1 rare lipoprotein A [Arcicella aurantiaca]